MVSSLRTPTEGREVLSSLDGEVGESILHANYAAVIAKVAPLSAEAKASLLAVCIRALTGPQPSKNNAVHIAAVRVIVALLPMSLGPVADLLGKFQNRHNYEVHFTLFCYLDWAQEMPHAPSLITDVLKIVEDYLMTVPRKTARAVWMAGNMLGEHCNEEEAVPLLVKAAHTAKYSVGRQLSILGLGDMLDRLPVGSAIHRDILRIVRKISSCDPSKYVREDAKALLQHWRRLSRT